ncbi:hypothetical protein ACQ4PT_045436 [Festuca glaucescens]
MRSLTTVRIGDGASTSLWLDNWTSLGPLYAALLAAFSHCLAPHATVADLLSVGGATLARQERLTAAAISECALLENAVSRFSPSRFPGERRLIGSDVKGFKVRDIYRILHSSGCGPPLHDLNWANFAPVRVKVFLWILRHRRTRTRARLHRLGILRSPNCPFYPGVVEDIQHLFALCPRLREIWGHASVAPSSPAAASLESLVESFSADHPSWPLPLRMTASGLLLWITWKTRNRMVFDGDRTSSREFFATVRQHVTLWLARAPRHVDCSALVSWRASLSP